jgi:PEP-CTERM motif
MQRTTGLGAKWILRATSIVAIFVASLMFAQRAQAAFHLWSLQQIYTNNTGTLQFIELSTQFSGQPFVGGQQIQVSNTGATQTHTFTIPSNLPFSPDTANRTFLIGTAGLHAAGGPAPDYPTLPNNFLFAGGGTISFFGANSGPYTALPTDGSLARNVGDGNAVNSPQNFAGQAGRVVIPEPGTFALLAIGAVSSLVGLSLRRKAA